MIAYHTALLAYKIIQTGKPRYLAQKLQKKNTGTSLRGNLGRLTIQRSKLTISREGFVQRAASILNNLDEVLRNEEKVKKFKVGLKKWVVKNIAIKPRSKFPTIENRAVSKVMTPVNTTSQHRSKKYDQYGT